MVKLSLYAAATMIAASCAAQPVVPDSSGAVAQKQTCDQPSLVQLPTQDISKLGLDRSTVSILPHFACSGLIHLAAATFEYSTEAA